MRAPEECPNCGADVPRGALACPECGSCAETGWSDEAADDPLGLSASEAFDYEEYVKREWGDVPDHSSARINGRTIATVLLIILVCWAFLK